MCALNTNDNYTKHILGINPGLIYNVLFSIPLSVTIASHFSWWRGLLLGFALECLLAAMGAYLPALRLKPKRHITNAILVGLCATLMVIQIVITSNLILFWKIAYCCSAGMASTYLALLMSTLKQILFEKWGKCSISDRIDNLLSEVNNLKEEQTSRLDKMIKSHALFTEGNEFEDILKWLEDRNHKDVKWIIAKVISKKLDSVFRSDEKITITEQNYPDHSELFAELVDLATNICLTCIYSPVEWFKQLEKVKQESLKFDLSPQVKQKFTNQELELVSENGELKYPEHFTKFLEKPPGSIRRRVFLLSETPLEGQETSEWSKLIDKIFAPHFKKFVIPCKLKSIETRFVNITELHGASQSIRSEDRKIIEKAQSSNIFAADYDIFNGRAVMSFSLQDHELTFKVKDVSIYKMFLDLIFRLETGKGVYNVDQMAEKLQISL